jgi:hypothetical protein
LEGKEKKLTFFRVIFVSSGRRKEIVKVYHVIVKKKRKGKAKEKTERRVEKSRD